MMFPRIHRVTVVLAVLCVVGFAHAIYDPREATTKPPQRREQVLPWYLSGKEYADSGEDPSRSPKWRADPDEPSPRKAFVVNAGTKTWSTWRKAPGSEIEQRTEIADDRQTPTNVDQSRDYSLEYSQFDQQEHRRFPSGSRDLEQEQDRDYEGDKGKRDKSRGGKDSQTRTDSDQYVYEGISADSTKPHREKILLSTKSKSTVARYDKVSGVQCPDPDSTGQFVYAPDCKFFVNCWQGRAFVQPCAPGTLFNPNTLECDFPHKVKCYGGEVADFPSNDYLDSSGRREPLLPGSHSHLETERLQEPRCPPYVTGLLAHPSDCAKYLQCANGGTFIRDCGPGTVFNPAVSVCDWPYNVRGCEDALKSKEETTTPLVPPDYETYDHRKLGYSEHQPAKKVACPEAHTGLLPHPDTCKKFLQCANGVTQVMDCGPGTAFNPATSVCDWPHKVPGCNADKPTFTQPPISPTTMSGPWSSGGSTESRPWQHNHRYNQTWHGYYTPGQASRPVMTTTPPGTDWDSLRPTWRPKWVPNTWTTEQPAVTDGDSSRPAWKPSWKPNAWTTATPPHPQGRYDHTSHGDDDRTGYGTHDHEHHYWDQAGSSSYPNTQWSHNHGTNDQSSSYDHRYHHHRDHHHRDGSTYDSDGDTETQQSVPPYGQPDTQRPTQGIPDGTWQPGRGHQLHHHHHGFHGRPQFTPEYDDSDQQTQQTVFEGTEGGRGFGGFDSSSNRNFGNSEGNSPNNRRTGQEYIPSRQEHGRNDPAFPPSNGNVYVGSNDELPVNEGTSSFNRQAKNRTTWSEPVGTESRLIPTSWSQQGSGVTPNQPQDRQWNQGTSNEGDKFHDWGSRANTYQSTADREADSKVNHWSSKTNIFEHSKGQYRPGAKAIPSSNVNVDANGTRGHFITKEIKVNQGHSKTKTYRSNDLPSSNDLNKGDQNIYIDSQSPFELPSEDLQPPHYTPVNDNGSQTNNISSHGRGHRKPKNHSSSQTESEDLIGSDINYPRMNVPPTNLQPPYYPPPSRSRTPPNSPNLQSNDNYYPPMPASSLQPPINEPSQPKPASSIGWQYPAVPATDLQPPINEPSQPKPASSIGWQYPAVPATDLQPPINEPSQPKPASSIGWQYPAAPATDLQPPINEPSQPKPASSIGWPNPAVPATDLQPPINEPSQSKPTSPIVWRYPALPATDLQPPYYDVSSTHQPSTSTNIRPPSRFLVPPDPDTPNASNQYPNVPSGDLEPPYHKPSNLSGSVSSSTQRGPDKHLIVPTKKKVLRTPHKPAPVSSTPDPNIPSVSIGESFATEYPDVTEPDLEHNVDVLDDKQVWKPVLVFENKSETTTTESSVIMKIGSKKRPDVDPVNIEAASFEEEEPPFPAYYVPPVKPLDQSKKNALPTPISGQVIRLRGGSGPHDGYLEVQGASPGWGTVCDSRNSWTLKEAHVVCRQLGYTRGAEMAWQGRNTRNEVPTWIAANSVSCQGNESRFQMCKFTHEPECRVERDAIGVRCTPNRVVQCRKDEIPYEGQCYHLADPNSSLNHAEALEYCSQRQARLVDITSQAENDFVSDWLVQMHPEVGSIMTSGVGFTTLNRTLWVWEDSSRAKFRYTKWWPGWMEDKKHPPFVGSRTLCIVMKRKFPCHARPDSICVADYFFWDTEDCATSMKGHSYICKRPYDDIGCIYGKGSQYDGNASVTATGKDCLPWADKKVAHPLRVNVVNREVREKLKAHNYCRNPNPNRETRPWCFTGPAGERESCDIPPCGSAGSQRSRLTGQCKPKHFECLPGECIPSPWVCDGEEDCTNGADESACISQMDLYEKHSKQKLEGYDVEKWLNTPLKTCALRCKDADFTCRSFAHKAEENVCLLSDSNVGMTGSLKPDSEFDYYEMKERSLNCEGMYVCGNQKCVNQTQVCDGKNDCNDRSDENICTAENLNYGIRLAGSNNSHEGRIEVKVWGVWGQVCDDGFGMIDAHVICKELGFAFGAMEIRPGGYYGNLDPPTRFMVDQLKCLGNETSLRECDFEGWGVHNCQPEEAVGVVCKTAVDSCPNGAWKCDKSPECIPIAFICDTVVDCADGSDESSVHCDAPFEIRLANGSSPLEGRVEVRHHGVWGTVCDDDFANAEATVICRSLGYGGRAVAKKDGFFGPGEGPIWLDEVDCYGNETQLYRCDHNHWGQHNCDHDEDAGVICTPGDLNDSKLSWESMPNLPETDINDILPAKCGKRSEDFNDDEDVIFAKVVHGTVAPRGTYPWQASIRIRAHSRSNHWCGAVVISPLYVLTAAHCLEGYNKGTYFVRAGDYNTEIDEGTEVEANIEDYYIHENFRKGHRMNNDIALVQLKGQGIPLGKDIMPICLPPENAEYPAGLNCTISGFGSIETGKSTHSKDLRYGWVPLLDQSVCRAGHVYGEGAISEGMVCAGHLDEGVDTCDGDSGGPLVCYHNGAFTLYGITSWGQHCGQANKPGVYVRVSHYRRWIDQKIRDSLAGR
ncbi:uncharacterized protein LOC143371719 isoform X2 [Andrena cerasifolii]|uniref:uncharacterized protein LOC143371719 isoform X2 n=1 Tax=Andrena cerasifolii TaxID=2819439 RepID=UPI004037A15D